MQNQIAIYFPHSFPFLSSCWSTRLVCGQFGVTVGRDCSTRPPGKPRSCVSRAKLTHSSKLRGPCPQDLILLGDSRFIAWRQGCPFLRECRRDTGYFVLFRRVWATALSLDPLKSQPSAMCYTRSFGGACNKYLYQEDYPTHTHTPHTHTQHTHTHTHTHTHIYNICEDHLINKVIFWKKKQNQLGFLQNFFININPALIGID